MAVYGFISSVSSLMQFFNHVMGVLCTLCVNPAYRQTGPFVLIATRMFWFVVEFPPIPLKGGNYIQFYT